MHNRLIRPEMSRQGFQQMHQHDGGLVQRRQLRLNCGFMRLIEHAVPQRLWQLTGHAIGK